MVNKGASEVLVATRWGASVGAFLDAIAGLEADGRRNRGVDRRGVAVVGWGHRDEEAPASVGRDVAKQGAVAI